MPLRAIIFDVDGTLAETEEAHRRAFNRAFAEAGLAWHWTTANYAALLTTTGGRERIARHMAESGLVPDPGLVAMLHAHKNDHYAAMVAAGEVTPRPGIVRLIARAHDAGLALAIATTTSRANLAALLNHAFDPGLAGRFDAIVAGEDVTRKKPDPEVYHQVLARLSLGAGDCVAIEDSAAGLAAARACGIATVITPSIYTARHDFSGAALVCDSLDGPGDAVDLARLRGIVASAG